MKKLKEWFDSILRSMGGALPFVSRKRYEKMVAVVAKLEYERKVYMPTIISAKTEIQNMVMGFKVIDDLIENNFKFILSKRGATMTTWRTEFKCPPPMKWSRNHGIQAILADIAKHKDYYLSGVADFYAGVTSEEMMDPDQKMDIFFKVGEMCPPTDEE